MIIADSKNRIVRATVDNGQPEGPDRWLEITAIRLDPDHQDKVALRVIRLKSEDALKLADFIREELLKGVHSLHLR